MFPSLFRAQKGIPWASLTMPETSRQELSNGVKFANSTAFFAFIFEHSFKIKSDLDLGVHACLTDPRTRAHAAARTGCWKHLTLEGRVQMAPSRHTTPPGGRFAYIPRSI